MDNYLVISWLVSSICLFSLAVTWMRTRFTAPGWMVLYLTIFLLSITGGLREQPAIINAAVAMWFILILLPGFIARLCYRRFMQQKYPEARRLAQILSWLHPADGYREQPEIIRAIALSQRGEITAALDALKRFQNVKSVIGLTAIANLYRITNQWEEFLVWQSQHSQELAKNPQFLHALLRTRGELGDVRGMVELFSQSREQIRKLFPAAQRDLCRLILFAFCGKRQAAEILCDGSLAVLPHSTRVFWLATADLNAGETESAKRQFEELLPAADPLLRTAIERRLSQITICLEPLDATAERVVEEATTEHAHEEKFGARRPLFSNRAKATQILIVLNVFMFGAECYLGGGENIFVLYRLGALFPPAVLAGQWWRLIMAMFLHCGALHLTMNMLGLWFLGPCVEFAIGFRRFLLVYLLTGIGSMATVLAFSFGDNAEALTVGASGCVMGLVGATGSLMLRGWLRENAIAAKRRLGLALFIVLMEVLVDFMIPQVSMIAHLSGACIGFAITMVLRDRLTLTPQPLQSR